jgi:hypothetical protein
MITLRIQAGDGGADASAFADSLGSMIAKSTGVSPVQDGSEIIFHRL